MEVNIVCLFPFREFSTVRFP